MSWANTRARSECSCDAVVLRGETARSERRERVQQGKARWRRGAHSARTRARHAPLIEHVGLAQLRLKVCGPGENDSSDVYLRGKGVQKGKRGSGGEQARDGIM